MRILAFLTIVILLFTITIKLDKIYRQTVSNSKLIMLTEEKVKNYPLPKEYKFKMMKGK